jgi:hypothetical protein
MAWTKYGISFSWKRALGITSAKRNLAKRIGVPITKNGMEKKLGSLIIKTLFGKK